MYNFNGGSLWIGIDPQSGQPQPLPPNLDPIATYDSDKVQGLVARHASFPFPVEVEFYQHLGVLYPNLKIPSGVRFPCAMKAPLNSAQNNVILKQHDVYTRSFSSSNYPASSIVQHGDWQEIFNKCFDNREADIGRFVRRHLTGLDMQSLQTLLGDLGSGATKVPTLEDEIKQLMDEGDKYFHEAVDDLLEPNWGTFEIGAIIKGTKLETTASRKFLETLYYQNPRHTPIPFWLVLQPQDFKPKLNQGFWQATINTLKDYDVLDFWRASEEGKFYSQRPFFEDTQMSAKGFRFDVFNAIDNVAEAIVCVQSFAKGLGYEPSSTSISFGFKWSGLSGRTLANFSKPNRAMLVKRTAIQKSFEASASVSLDVPSNALASHIRSITQPLLKLFDGLEFDLRTYEELLQELLSQKY